MVDNDRDSVIYPAIDALVKINSVKSLPILINIYKNLDVEYYIKIRAYSAIKELAEKNSFYSLKKIFSDASQAVWAKSCFRRLFVYFLN